MTEVQLTDIDRRGVLDLMKQDVPIVDVLSEEEYRKAHLAGAINMPLRSIGRDTAGRLDPTQPIVVYCYDYQ